MKKYALLLLMLLPIMGCVSQEPSEHLEIKDTVQAYTSLLIEGYKTLNMTPLNRISTPRRTTKAYHHMAALGEGNIRMDAKVEQIIFLDTKLLDTGKAEVKTSERWMCQYFNIDTGQKNSENIITYKNIYHLIYENGRWLVDDITIINSNETNKNSGLPFYQRSADTPIGTPQPTKNKDQQAK